MEGCVEVRPKVIPDLIQNSLYHSQAYTLKIGEGI